MPTVPSQSDLSASRATVTYRRATGISWRPFETRLADLVSTETCFALFLVSGRIKGLPELRGSPVDLTLLFLVISWGRILWEIMSGRLRPLRLTLPVVLMILFCEFAVASLFWSSLIALNLDKAGRFLVLTASSFFAACMLAQDPVRRKRLLIAITWLSCAIVLYYLHYRYVLGIDIMAPEYSWIDRETEGGNNYLEYGEHASILFTVLLALAVFGSWRRTWLAAAGASVALFVLLSLGSRGPLAAAAAAVPALGVVLIARRGTQKFNSWRHLVGFGAIMIGIGFGGYALTSSEHDNGLGQLHTIERYQLELSGENTQSLDWRSQGRSLAFRQWLNKPLAGWGIGEFRVQDSFLMYPHNTFLEILMEMGLIGVCLFIGIAGSGLITCWNIVRQPYTEWADIAIILLFVTSLCWEMTFAGYLADDRIFFSYLGMVIGSGVSLDRHG
ncbi:MAG: O-antigen ligase family protein [Acetobacteraceae bacterium]|nr:O-antigen ligase family protein [Acetobacteraceae bacterium]